MTKANLQNLSTTEEIVPFRDYPRTALRCMILASQAYAEGRSDMDARDMAEIGTVYGIPWGEMGVALQGDFYTWWFAGISKAAK